MLLPLQHRLKESTQRTASWFSSKWLPFDDDVVAADDVQAGRSVVGEDAVGDARILVAVDEVDAVAAVVIDRDAVQEDLLDLLRADAVAALRDCR